MNINDRIKHLRKDVLKVTQQEFSESLNISRSNMGNIEIGRIAVTDRVISDICLKYDVSENWLRNGSGYIFISKTRNQLITDFMGDLIKEEDESFKRRLIEALAQLDIEEWELLENIARKTLKKG